jgi:hypothetical protein
VSTDGHLRGEVVGTPSARAGSEAELVLDLWWDGRSVDAVEASLHGLAGARLALDGGRAVLRPGVRRRVVGTLRLPAGVEPGRYDLAVELRCQLDVDAELVLPVGVEVVADPGPVVRIEKVGRGQGRALVHVTNPTDVDESVALTAWARQMRFAFAPPVLEVPAGETRTAKLKIRSGGRRGRFVVTAATASTTTTAAATVRSRRSGAAALLGSTALFAVLASVGQPLAGLPRAPLHYAWSGVSNLAAQDAATSEFEAAMDEAAAADGELSDPFAPGATPGVVVPGADPGTGVAPIAGDDPSVTLLPGGTQATGTGECIADAPTGWRLRGRVVADGPAIVDVRPTGKEHEPVATVTTTPDGVFAVCGIDRGDYIVAAVAQGYYAALVPASLSGDDDGVDIGTLRLQPGAASVLGTVQGPNGPIEGALATVLVGGSEVAWARSAADGAFEILGVPAPADATLRVEAVGFFPEQLQVDVRVPGRLRQPPTTLDPTA